MDEPLTILPPKYGRLRYGYRDHVITVVGKFCQIDDYTDTAHFGDSIDDAMRMIDEIFYAPMACDVIEDDLPITESWWFEQTGSSTWCWDLDGTFMLYWDGGRVVQLCAEGIENGASTYTMNLPHIKTRGDVMGLRKMILGKE